MSPHRQDSEPIASANQAPLCQHVRAGGTRCGAPARRGKRLCQFHHVVAEIEELDRMMAPKGEATLLQLALWQVMRVLRGPAPDYKACRLMLHALEIAVANLKNFAAEQADHARSCHRRNGKKGGEQRREKPGPKVWIT